MALLLQIAFGAGQHDPLQRLRDPMTNRRGLLQLSACSATLRRLLATAPAPDVARLLSADVYQDELIAELLHETPSAANVVTFVDDDHLSLLDRVRKRRAIKTAKVLFDVAGVVVRPDQKDAMLQWLKRPEFQGWVGHEAAVKVVNESVVEVGTESPVN